VEGRRYVPLSGVAAVILFVAGEGAAGNTPKLDASISSLVSFYSTHDDGQVASGVLLSLGALFFLIFSAAVVDALRRAEVGSHLVSTLCFSGAVVFVVGLTIAAGLAVFIDDTADHLDPAALQALHVASLTVVFSWSIGTGAFLLGAGAGTLQTGLLPTLRGSASGRSAAFPALSGSLRRRACTDRGNPSGFRIGRRAG